MFGRGSQGRNTNLDGLEEEHRESFSRQKRHVAKEKADKDREKENVSDKEEEEDKVSDNEEEDDDTDTDVDLPVSSTDPQVPWQDVPIKGARPPHPLMVTHVNQTHDLQRLSHAEAAINAEFQTSEEWLKIHSVEYMKLTLKDLIDKGKIGRLEPDHRTGKASQHIQFDAYDVNEFEYKLNLAIEMYTKRIKWLLQGSKRVFGNIHANRIVILVDSSDANTGFGRLTAFQESLLHLIDEQVSQKKGMYLVSFGTDIDPLWPCVRDVNCRIDHINEQETILRMGNICLLMTENSIEEAKEFVMRMSPKGGCNLLKAMKHVYKLEDIDSIVIILGSVPDQSAELLCDYIYQMGVGRNIPLHAVAYDCSNHMTNLTLRSLAEASGGRYHCYTASCEEQIYTGTDISIILKEIQKVQEIINRIKEMRQGMMGSALISIMDEISTEVSKLPQSRFLPRPPGHDSPLKIEFQKFHPKTSVEWIRQHGLKAKKLDLYQVLAPNAYSYKEEFIPIIKKAVQSQVHEKAMVQFQWHDGSVKNVHVDMSQLFEYQKQLAATVSLYESRIDWLASGSRRIFGSVVEKNIVILVDVSVSNVSYLVHIQHSLRLLMEQQIGNKEFFNIIAFGSATVAWRPTMMKPTAKNLQDAWRWVLDLQCGGSRNFLSAFRMAVENEEELSHKTTVEGIYLFTSGVPDQHIDSCTAYIEECTSGRGIKLHAILFNVDDYDANGAIPGRYANITRTAECLRSLAHCSGGRFHWIRETGIIESDDIQYVTSEVDKCLNFSRKVQMLVDSVKKKYRERYHHYEDMKALPAPEYTKLKALPPPPRQSLKQIKAKEGNSDDEKKVSPQRPSSAKSSDKPLLSLRRPVSAKDPMERVKNKKILRSSFFMDATKNKVGDGTGTVYKKYPETKSVRKIVARPTLPDQEDVMTTKEWIRIYSLSKLKLDLNKLVAGPDCKHQENHVKSLSKTVSAKYCDIFPSINVKGTIKHLQLLPHELEEYEVQVERVLRRYLKRLQWLLSGSRRVFGTVVHKKCIFLIDTSGSMEPYMEELKRELASLIWDQLYRQGVKFNMVQFSGACEAWKNNVQPATQENCHDAIKWTSRLEASGNTCTLEALKMAFADYDIDAIYVLTDGKPDTSTSMVLREVSKMNEDRHVQVNAISFNCSDNTANNFLRLLATETGGRYHRCQSDFDAQLFAHKLLSEGFADSEYPHLPDLEGDDLRRLGEEIALARKYIAQARQYRSLYNTKTTSTEKPQPKEKLTPFRAGRPKSSER